MHVAEEKPERLWSIILAGGGGVRLKSFIQRWKGRHIPKQYCTFVGSRSMLQHTLRRTDQVALPTKKLTVIAREHQHEAFKHFDHYPGRVVIQPANRDTAAGIFLPLTYVRAVDPNATVVIYPSDHFVFPEKPFVDVIHGALGAAKRWQNKIVLLGVVPDSPEPDYGWIYPGQNLGVFTGVSRARRSSFFRKAYPR